MESSQSSLQESKSPSPDSETEGQSDAETIQKNSDRVKQQKRKQTDNLKKQQSFFGSGSFH